MLKIKLTGLLCIAFAISCLAQNTPTPQWRPLYHFTPPVNWTNDPNGLIFLNGKFNLYYQHNPFENKWGHMSWGHATSSDLVNWKNLPVAIPEMTSNDTITMIYSGSAVLDKNNTSGFGSLNNPPVVAIYTADLRNQHKEKQHIAYSNDGGLTFKQYAKNPVIDLDKKDFRDPNVFWYTLTKQWIMTVAMVDEHQVRIYGSKNLKEWTKLSDFGPAGFIKNGWECPSLLPLTVNNNPAKVKWVLLVSAGGEHGPLMQYYVGDFDGHTFKNDNAADKVLMVDYGDAFYAAIAWRDALANKKILLGWLQNGRPETSPWKGQMSIPRDLSFKTTADGIRLIQAPTSIISGSLAKLAKGAPLVKKDMGLSGSLQLSKPGSFDQNTYWIDATIKPNQTGKIEFWIAGNKDGQKIKAGYDAEKQELYIDCSATESANKDPRNLVQTAPLKPVNGLIKVSILMDKSSLEVFGNDGESVISTMVYPAEGNNILSVASTGEIVFPSLKVWDMASIRP